MPISNSTLTLAGCKLARFIEAEMRPAMFRCPNYSNCLLGYRGEDIEVSEGMDPVCPECGTPLEPKKSPKTSLIPSLINWITVAALVCIAWLVWPFLQKAWTKITTNEPAPPAQQAPAPAPAPTAPR